MSRFVVIGGDAAGMSAAAQATRGETPPDVVVFERGVHTSYAACGLPYYVGGLVSDPDHLVARSPEEHRARGIDVRIRHEVVGIDTDARSVVVRDLADGRERTEPYDHLLVATGAVPLRPPWPGVDAPGVFGLHSIPEATAILDAVRSRDPRRAVVVGAGYIGLEIAEAFELLGLEVTVVERLDQPMTTLDPDMAARVATGMTDLGVDLRLGTTVDGMVVGDDGWVRAVATDTGEVPADIVVLGLGVRPNGALAEAAGIPIGPTGGVVTDARMATPVDGVWAAGDCAQSVHRVTGAPAAIALGTHANKQGRVAGINIGGGYLTFPGIVRTAISKVCELEISRTGLRVVDAERAGYDVLTATVRSTTTAGYIPGAQQVTTKVIAERVTGQLLGVQIVGRSGSAKRIDAAAVALWNRMTVEEMSALDLAYAPPFSPVWDPVLIAARKAAELVAADRSR